MGTPGAHPESIAVDDVRRLIRNARTAAVNELVNRQDPTAAAAIVACINNLENAIDLHLMAEAGVIPADDGHDQPAAPAKATP